MKCVDCLNFKQEREEAYCKHKLIADSEGKERIYKLKTQTEGAKSGYIYNRGAKLASLNPKNCHMFINMEGEI